MIIKKHLGQFYQVTGERRVLKLDEQTGNLIDTGKVLSPRVRFEALRVQDAEVFATEVYRRENIVCEIHEVSR